MSNKETLEKLKTIIDDLIEKNKKIPVVVEGEKDLRALRKLGVKGKIITLNQGLSLTDFSDKIAKDNEEIIILTDWDRKGGHLCYVIKKNLKGRVKCNTFFRTSLAQNTTIRKIEGLPHWINTIKIKISGV